MCELRLGVQRARTENPRRWFDSVPLPMLWAYLDDSAVRFKGNNGPPNRYALGGGIAQCDVWQEVTTHWQARLQDSGNPSKVEWFHYKDWKRAYYGCAKEGESFYGWTQSQLEQLITDLTRIISKRQVDYLCASIRAVASKRVVRDSYAAVTTDVINRAEQIADRVHRPDKISFMFSMHAELSGIRIQKYFEMLKRIHPLTAYCVIGDSRKEPALQAADLIVNEMATSRFVRASYGHEFHMPFMARVMQVLKQEPPFHHMIELHKDDDLEAKVSARASSPGQSF